MSLAPFVARAREVEIDRWFAPPPATITLYVFFGILSRMLFQCASSMLESIELSNLIRRSDLDSNHYDFGVAAKPARVD